MSETETPRYRVLQLSYLHKQLHMEGDEVDYVGEPGTNLHPLNDAAKTAYKAKHGAVPGDAPEEEEEEEEEDSTELTQLRDDYEALFNKKPHPAMKADTLREKIAEKRTELGQ